ncbi:RagB/SusD family nutrient uptake outer membrane protein [Chitinophaga horti]|uniref:RagB/SusD family nutrient uptake outer membrane protein n=1 Tax=Chitinophaga horti TaxID=2920382 RepID=A0ABY6J3P8_9BACT|nr:RagB/SusD family nutrient uptake outer membrane protein [Chitinophaga horti]UYQ94135.1 RagB/SusD family nutrient uptake outer membrane protein [Chitinophaga horti]
MKQLIYIIAAAAMIATGCRKYVEIDQIGKRTLTYTKDYRAILDNNSQLEAGFFMPIYSGDDTRILDSLKQVQLLDIPGNVYSWQAQYWGDTQSDSDWEKLYKAIYTCNEVLAGVMDSKNGTDADKRQLYAEALTHRAYAYWCLVNIYGPQYDSATAAKDLGVPVLLTPDLFTPLNRASVAIVYDRIITDLKAAAADLPTLPDYNTRPSKAAVYSLLARTYLMTRDFTNARSYAEQTLALQSGLLDLRTYQTSATGFPYRLADPEVIFSKVNANAYPFAGVQLDTALLSLLGTKDLRYTLFVRPGASFSPAFTGFGYWRQKYSRETNMVTQGPGVPEMMLIKAECAARSNDAATATDILNTIRTRRFRTADYVALTPGTAQQALENVVNERKREFFGTGLRWFDQKRLNKDAAFARTVTRRFKGVEYILEPNSPRYTYPIGTKYILLNPEIEQSIR